MHIYILFETKVALLNIMIVRLLGATCGSRVCLRCSRLPGGGWCARLAATRSAQPLAAVGIMLVVAVGSVVCAVV